MQRPVPCGEASGWQDCKQAGRGKAPVAKHRTAASRTNSNSAAEQSNAEPSSTLSPRRLLQTRSDWTSNRFRLKAQTHLFAGAKSRKCGSSSEAASSAAKPATTMFSGCAGGARAVAMSTFARRPKAADLSRFCCCFCLPPPNSQPVGAPSRPPPVPRPREREDSDLASRAEGAFTALVTVWGGDTMGRQLVRHLQTYA